MNKPKPKNNLIFVWSDPFWLVCILLVGFTLGPLQPKAQPSSTPTLLGYFHNWNFAPAPYLPLNQVPSDYNLIAVAFALPTGGTDYRISFVPEMVSPAQFRQQMQSVQSQGRKIILSVGGATAPIILNNAMERDSFVASINRILYEFPFDGLDLNLEGASLQVSAGSSIQAPTDTPILMMIQATQQLMADFQARTSRRMLLTLAPETAYVQGGQSAFSGVWGAYLPLLHALRDSIHLLSVQLYNSGSMYGIDGGIYHQGTADFIVAMVEAVIRGFPTSGGYFAGLNPGQVVIALPACPLAAGGGYTDSLMVRAAARYLKGIGPTAGSYLLAQPGGYPNLGGMMTWSINWDAVSSCASSWEYVRNYRSVFGGIGTGISPAADARVRVYPNPMQAFLRIDLHNDPTGSFTHGDRVRVCLFDSFGRNLRDEWVLPGNIQWDVHHLAHGVYYLYVANQIICLVK